MSAAMLSDLPEGLAQLHQFYSSIPAKYLLVGHSLLVASMFRSLRDRFLLSYWVAFSAAFGGGVVSALLVMDGSVSPVPLFAVNALGYVWSICWWAINYCPGDLAFRLFSLRPVKMVAKCCTAILRCGLITSRVDLAVKLFPGVVAAPLVLGTLGGSAGKFIVDAILLVSGDSRGPSEAAVPSFIWRSGVLAATTHYLLVYVFHLATVAQSYSALVTFFLAHSITQDLLGMPLDFTTPFSALFHSLTNIPAPSAPLPAAAKAAAPVKATTASPANQNGSTGKAKGGKGSKKEE